MVGRQHIKYGLSVYRCLELKKSVDENALKLQNLKKVNISGTVH